MQNFYFFNQKWNKTKNIHINIILNRNITVVLNADEIMIIHQIKLSIN